MPELSHVGRRLAGLGYDEQTLTAALGIDRLVAPQPAKLPLYERRLAGHGPLGVLAGTFWLGRSTSRPALEELLGPEGVGVLIAAGLAAAEDGLVRPAMRLTPFAGMVFAHDAESGPVAA
ncbi:MAG: hypothetical protein ACLGI3_04750, partial [Actinomycetes bacterium]